MRPNRLSTPLRAPRRWPGNDSVRVLFTAVMLLSTPKYDTEEAWLREYMIATTAKKKHYYESFRNRVNAILKA